MYRNDTKNILFRDMKLKMYIFKKVKHFKNYEKCCTNGIKLYKNYTFKKHYTLHFTHYTFLK